MGIDDDDYINKHRSLHYADSNGEGAGSYAPYADLPAIHVFLHFNGHLLPGVLRAPDSQFDYTEWESKYMFTPTFETDFGNGFYHPFDHDSPMEWDSYTESTFTPLVTDENENYIVAGHVGYVLATDIVIPRNSSIPHLFRSGRDVAQWKKYLSEQLNNYLAQGGIAYVETRPGDKIQTDDQQWPMWDLTEDAFLVFVDPNGQLLQVLEVIEKRAKSVGTIVREFIGFSLDVLMVLDLAAVGIRLGSITVLGIRSGVKSAGRKILAFILRKEAKSALNTAVKEVLELTAEEQGALALIRKQFPDLAKLTDHEIISIRRYSDNAWADINAALRGASNPNQVTNALAKNVVSGLQKLPGYTGELTRSEARSITEAIKEYKDGSEVVMKGLTSASRAGAVAQREGNIAMTIKAVGKNGKDIAKMAKHAGHETEVLFLPGTRFLVEHTKRVGDALLVVLREL